MCSKSGKGSSNYVLKPASFVLAGFLYANNKGKLDGGKST